jgi:oligoendopeptidase F
MANRLNIIQRSFSKLVGQVVPLEQSLSKELWEFYTRGDPPNWDTLRDEKDRIVTDPSWWNRLVNWSTDKTGEPFLDRQVILWLKYFQRGRIDADKQLRSLHDDLRNHIAGFRGRVNDKYLTVAGLEQILETHSDRSTRYQAFEELSRLSKMLTPKLLEAIQRYHVVTQEVIHRDPMDWTLEEEELHHDEIEDWVRVIDKATAEPARVAIERITETLKYKQLAPWDLLFGLNQQRQLFNGYFEDGNKARETLTATVRQSGLDPKVIASITWDLEDRPSKFGTYSYCFSVDPPYDVRVTVNPRPRPGFLFWQTLFHEGGHALHVAHMGKMPWIFRYPKSEGGASCESMATVWQNLLTDPEWLAGYTSLGSSDRKAFLRLGSNLSGAGKTLSLRAKIHRFDFEWTLYKAFKAGSVSSNDADALFWQSYHRWHSGIQQTNLPFFAREILYGTHPIYVQNYFVADLAADQILGAYRDKATTLWDGGFGSWLQEHFWSPGALRPWRQKLQSATGTDLTPKATIDRVMRECEF